MSGKFDDNFSGDVIPGRLRKIVDDHRERRAVGHKAIKRQHVCGMHLRFVVVRSADHGNVIAQPGGMLGQPQSFDCRFNASARDQDFAGRSRFTGGLEHVAFLLVRKHERLAGRTEHDYTGYRSFGIAFNIVLKLFVVDVAVRIKWRGNRRENAVKEHGIIFSQEGTQSFQCPDPQQTSTCGFYFICTSCAAGTRLRTKTLTWSAISVKTNMGKVNVVIIGSCQ